MIFSTGLRIYKFSTFIFIIVTIDLTFHFDVDEVFRDRLERELEAAHDVVGKLPDDLEDVLWQNLLQNFVLEKLILQES